MRNVRSRTHSSSPAPLGSLREKDSIEHLITCSSTRPARPRSPTPLPSAPPPQHRLARRSAATASRDAEIHPEGSGCSVLEHLLGECGDGAEDRGFPGQLLAHASRCLPIRLGVVLRRSSRQRGWERQRVTTAGLRGTGLRSCRSSTITTRSSHRKKPRPSRPRFGRCSTAATVTDRRTRRAAAHRPISWSSLPTTCRSGAFGDFPRDVEVGTVDKFQGREAAIVFFSMTTSRGEDVPRGLEFLFNRNRFNVAVSRASVCPSSFAVRGYWRRAVRSGRTDAASKRAVSIRGAGRSSERGQLILFGTNAP